MLFSGLFRFPFGEGPIMPVMKESMRVLGPEGLLIAQRINEREIEYAKSLGFSAKIIYTGNDRYKMADAVFGKGIIS